STPCPPRDTETLRIWLGGASWERASAAAAIASFEGVTAAAPVSRISRPPVISLTSALAPGSRLSSIRAVCAPLAERYERIRYDRTPGAKTVWDPASGC